MVPTFSNQIKTELLTEFLGTNLAIALINYPELGLTDVISQDQALLRAAFTIDDINTYEIGADSLNGYQRQFIQISSNDVIGEEVKRFISSVEFTAVGGDFSEATHIVVLRGAKTIDATDENGNNRGSSQGTIIYVEPIENAPLILQANNVFEYTLSLISNIGTV